MENDPRRTKKQRLTFSLQPVFITSFRGLSALNDLNDLEAHDTLHTAAILFLSTNVYHSKFDARLLTEVVFPWKCDFSNSQGVRVKARLGLYLAFSALSQLRQVSKSWRQFFQLESNILRNERHSTFFGHSWTHKIGQFFFTCRKSSVRELHLYDTTTLYGMRPLDCANLHYVSIHVKNGYELYKPKTQWVPFFSQSTPRFELILDDLFRSTEYTPKDLYAFHGHVTHAKLQQIFADLPTFVLKMKPEGVYPRLQELTLRGLTVLNLVELLEAMPMLHRLVLVNTFIVAGISVGLGILANRKGSLEATYDGTQSPRTNSYFLQTSPDTLREQIRALQEAMVNFPTFCFHEEEFAFSPFLSMM